ncbi:hypothetical protein [Carboxylicivirga linearis]|uniref:Uncharacterized protein n=1 Tax=Carboxylicivirga linearis TaxID=1628157 RepID=A0ABS5K0M3_9BACT|nr:hypothetical protein [Carboxylicivirga linearis]MBS2100713.1 hypothetical protein [Carboxylicivirga linearis]
MREDFLLNDDKEFATEDGDFITGESDDQHVELLLVLHKGELKENPTIGVGLSNFIGKQTTSKANMKREIKVGLQADNYKVKTIDIEDNGHFDLDYELEE